MFSSSKIPDREPKYKIGDITIFSLVVQEEEVLKITGEPTWVRFYYGEGIFSWRYSTSVIFSIRKNVKRYNSVEKFSYVFEENMKSFQEYIDEQVAELEKRRELLLKTFDELSEMQSNIK